MYVRVFQHLCVYIHKYVKTVFTAVHLEGVRVCPSVHGAECTTYSIRIPRHSLLTSLGKGATFPRLLRAQSQSCCVPPVWMPLTWSEVRSAICGATKCCIPSTPSSCTIWTSLRPKTIRTTARSCRMGREVRWTWTVVRVALVTT